MREQNGLGTLGVVFLVTAQPRLAITAKRTLSTQLEASLGGCRPLRRWCRVARQRQERRYEGVPLGPLCFNIDAGPERLRWKCAPASSDPRPRPYYCHHTRKPL